MVESVAHVPGPTFPPADARSATIAVHRPQHSAGDGRQLPLRSATREASPAGRRGRRPAATGSWSTKAAAARRSSRGWSRTSATASSNSTPPASCSDVVVVPIGFISDHMEVLFDLDTEARELCERAGRPHAARRDRRHPSAVRHDDSRADRRADRPAPPSGRRWAAWRRATTCARPTAASTRRATCGADEQPVRSVEFTSAQLAPDHQTLQGEFDDEIRHATCC